MHLTRVTGCFTDEETEAERGEYPARGHSVSGGADANPGSVAAEVAVPSTSLSAFAATNRGVLCSVHRAVRMRRSPECSSHCVCVWGAVAWGRSLGAAVLASRCAGQAGALWVEEGNALQAVGTSDLLLCPHLLV